MDLYNYISEIFFTFLGRFIPRMKILCPNAWFAVLLSLQQTAVVQVESFSPEKTDKILEHLFKSYSKTGFSKQDGPTEVKVGFYINHMVANDLDMNLGINFYFRQSWTDKRLKFHEDVTRSWNDSTLNALSAKDISLYKFISHQNTSRTKCFSRNLF